MELEESMVGEDSEPEGMCSKFGGNTFYNRKNKIPMKILEFKRSKIGLIAEFSGIPNGFPNQGSSMAVASCSHQEGCPHSFTWLPNLDG
jgi:hypothetical protein